MYEIFFNVSKLILTTNENYDSKKYLGGLGFWRLFRGLRRPDDLFPFGVQPRDVLLGVLNALKPTFCWFILECLPSVLLCLPFSMDDERPLAPTLGFTWGLGSLLVEAWVRNPEDEVAGINGSLFSLPTGFGCAARMAATSTFLVPIERRPPGILNFAYLILLICTRIQKIIWKYFDFVF